MDDGPALIDLKLPMIAGPAELGAPASARRMGTFNPSIVRAPHRLCPRCAWVAALRVDPLHQCDRSSPLYHSDLTKPSAATAWFKGTAIVVLDADWRVLGTHTWLINSPLQQARPRIVSDRTATVLTHQHTRRFGLRQRSLRSTPRGSRWLVAWLEPLRRPGRSPSSTCACSAMRARSLPHVCAPGALLACTSSSSLAT